MIRRMGWDGERGRVEEVGLYNQSVSLWLHRDLATSQLALIHTNPHVERML